MPALVVPAYAKMRQRSDNTRRGVWICGVSAASANHAVGAEDGVLQRVCAVWHGTACNTGGSGNMDMVALERFPFIFRRYDTPAGMFDFTIQRGIVAIVGDNGSGKVRWRNDGWLVSGLSFGDIDGTEHCLASYRAAGKTVIPSSWYASPYLQLSGCGRL